MRLIGLPLLLAAPFVERAEISWCRPILARFPATIQASGLFMVAAVALLAAPHVAANVAARPMADAGLLGAHIEMSTEPPLGMGLHHGDLPFADGIVYGQIKSAQQLLGTLPLGTRVATLEIANIALTMWSELRQSPGAMLWYDYDRTFSDQVYPKPQEAFAGADVILVPQHFTTDTTQRLVGLYQPWLDRCTTVMAANDQWRLYKSPGAVALPTGAVSADKLLTDMDCFILARP